jgi:hypothetical protein
MAVADSSEIMGPVYQITECHTPEDCSVMEMQPVKAWM